ncbi:hypothetical protein AB7X03_14145 [Providencia rettgeri]
MKAVKNKTLARLPAIIAAGMGVVPAHGIGFDNYPVINNESFVYESIPDKLVSIPLEEATIRMRAKTERMQGHLKSIKEEWAERNYAPIKPNKKRIGSQYRHYMDLSVANMTETLNAVKEILKTSDHLSEDEKTSLVDYGRSVSLYITTCKNIVSFIEQTHRPKKTTDAKLSVTDADVKKLIRSEHEKLGLGKPSFDMAGSNG